MLLLPNILISRSISISEASLGNIEIGLNGVAADTLAADGNTVSVPASATSKYT